MSIGIGLDVRFIIDGAPILGKIKVVRPEAEIASFRSVISFEAPSLVALRILDYIDTLGKGHIVGLKQQEEAGKLLCLRTCVGGPTYMKDFYEKLGIALPSLKEGKEPDMLEVIDFVYPPAAAAGAAAAGAAAIDDPRATALALYERAQEVKSSLDPLYPSLYQAKANLAHADARVPRIERLLRDELVQKIQEIRAEITAQQAILNEIFRELSVHFPTIEIPPLGTPVVPIDPGMPAVGGAHAMPPGRPGSEKTSQTFRE